MTAISYHQFIPPDYFFITFKIIDAWQIDSMQLLCITSWYINLQATAHLIVYFGVLTLLPPVLFQVLCFTAL